MTPEALGAYLRPSIQVNQAGIDPRLLGDPVRHNDPTDVSLTKQRLSGIFDGDSATFDRVGSRFFSHFGRCLVDVARIPAGCSVLDVATGRGAVLLPAALAGGQQGSVTGIDFSEKKVNATSRAIEQTHELGFPRSISSPPLSRYRLSAFRAQTPCRGVCSRWAALRFPLQR